MSHPTYRKSTVPSASVPARYRLPDGSLVSVSFTGRPPLYTRVMLRSGVTVQAVRSSVAL